MHGRSIYCLNALSTSGPGLPRRQRRAEHQGFGQEQHARHSHACWTIGAGCRETRRGSRLAADTHGFESVHRKRSMWSRITNDWTTLAQVNISRCLLRVGTRTTCLDLDTKRIINEETRLAHIMMSRWTSRAWTTTTRLDMEMKRIMTKLGDVALDIKRLDKNSGDETHHQRLDQACPGANVAFDIKRLDENNIPRLGDGPHQRCHQARRPGEHVALDIMGLDNNNTPRSGDVLAERTKHGVVESGSEVVSLPTHTASNPNTTRASTAGVQRQRLEQACPSENVALDAKGLDKNGMPKSHLVSDGRVGARCCQVRQRSHHLDNTHGLEPVHGESVYRRNAPSTTGPGLPR